MSGGIYNGPDGQLLHGDGKPVREPIEPKQPERTSDRIKYESTYGYKRLLEEHKLDEVGFWVIYGEDPNPDFCGSHYEPLLETIEGKLDDVINYGIKLKDFWQYGGGGRFVKLTIKKL